MNWKKPDKTFVYRAFYCSPTQKEFANAAFLRLNENYSLNNTQAIIECQHLQRWLQCKL